MGSITYSGNFGEEAAGRYGLETTISSGGSTVPSNATITSITYHVTVGADAGYEPNESYNCYWFVVYQSTSSNQAAHKGSINGTTVQDSVAVTGNRGYISGSMTVDNASVFKQYSTLKAHCKANITKNVRSNMRECSIVVEYTEPVYYTIAWNSGASLSAVQTSGTSVTFTLSGSAYTSPSGLSITYQLYEIDSGEVVTIGTFSNGTLSTTVSPGTHSYFVAASADTPSQGTISATGPSLTFTVSGPIVQFSSGASISFSASGGEATITLSGSASITNGYSGTVYYRVYEVYNGSPVQRNAAGDTNTQWIFVPYTAQDTYTEYDVDAYVIYNGVTYASTTTLSCSGSVPSPVLTWTAGSYISVAQSGDNAVVTLHGDAVVGGGFVGSPYYRVWFGTVRKNQDGDTSKTWSDVPPQYDVTLTYTVRAYANIGGTEYESTNLTASAIIDGGNYIDYFNGTSWVQCKAYYYNGTGWVECKPFYYNGLNWVEISS